MEETTTPSPDYIKGFNEGYLIAREAPLVADKLTRIKVEDDRLQGLQDGQRQFLLEKAQGLRKTKGISPASKNDPQKPKDKDYNIDR